MKTTKIGQQAESAVADFLNRQGWQILTKNWKTSRCEIDVVARKDGIIYFVEVKYRSSQSQGDGLAQITPHKLNQMQFAARVWNQHNNWDGDWRLLAASVSPGIENVELVELE